VRHATATGEIAERGRLGGLYPQALYLHFRAVIDFYVKDTSPRYERTDAFVEKSVTLAFDLLRTQAIDSAFDLLRFLAPRITGRS
jgi:ubiquinone biosynthesis protein COQ9